MLMKSKLWGRGLMAAGLTLMSVCGAIAQETDLATAATNPVGSANQLQFQNLFIEDSNNAEGSGANTFIVQPILSFALPEESYFQTVVSRFTIPYVSSPKIGGFDKSGLGDTLALIFPTHSTPGDVPGEFSTWGPGLAVSVPTSSEPLVGNNTWSAGPGLIYLKNVKLSNGNSLMLGGAAWHLWDIEGGKADVSATSGFPALIYKFDKLFDQKGWYVRAPDDVWTYDWKADEFTQIPIGAGIGRAFVMGKQPVNVFLAGWWNAASPDTATTPEWAIKASFSLVFPK